MIWCQITLDYQKSFQAIVSQSGLWPVCKLISSLFLLEGRNWRFGNKVGRQMLSLFPEARGLLLALRRQQLLTQYLHVSHYGLLFCGWMRCSLLLSHNSVAWFCFLLSSISNLMLSSTPSLVSFQARFLEISLPYIIDGLSLSQDKKDHQGDTISIS